MAFLLVKELASTSGGTLGGGEGVEEPLLSSLEAPPDELPLDFLTAPPDLPCSRPTLEPTGTGGEGVGRVLPDLLMAPPDLSGPGLGPCEGGGVCESS